MKKITFIIAMFLTALGYSQSLPIEFNDAEVFEGQGGVTYSEAVSPTFSLNKVGKMEGGGEEWSSLIGLNLDTYINMTTSEKTFTFEFYTTEAVAMNGLLQLNSEENGGYPIEMEFTTDGSIGWETITLNFNGARNGYPNSDAPVVYGNYATINVFTNFGDTGSSTYYIDNIKGAVNGAAVPDPGTDPEEEEPEVAASTPSQESADVISVYSDAYSSIATNLNPNWGQATDATEIQIEGNNTLKYAGLNYQGMDYPQTDVSAMEYVHLDYYTNDATALDFFLISTGPLENAYTIPVVTGSWQSIDIPLTEYTTPELDKVFQFKTVGNGTVYLDNLYFWKAPTAAGTDTSLSALTVDGNSIAGFGPLSSSYSVELPVGTTVVPTVAATPTDANASVVVTAAASIPGTTTIAVTAQDETTTRTVSIVFSIDPTPTSAAEAPDYSGENSALISVYSEAYGESIGANLNPGWGQATVFDEIDINGNKFMEYANLNYQGIEFDETDVSGMGYIHLNYYTNDATALEFFLITTGEGGTEENAYDITASENFALGQWVSLDIPLSFYSDAGQNLEKAFQFKTVGDGTVYLDNLVFAESVLSVGGVQKETLQVAPNPTSGLINKSGDVYNVSGQKVLTNSNDLSGLPSGIYFIKVISNGNVSTTKIIKE